MMPNIADLLKGGAGGELGLNEFLVSILFSLAAGIICMFLYRIYFSNASDRNMSLNRSFVFIAPSISAIFWAIQYSLPLSLGLLGALSFVRFRTPIKKGEDIGFILLVIALSLLSSVYRFQAAAILLGVLICVTFAKAAIVDRRFPFIDSIPLLRSGTMLTIFLSTTSSDVERADRAIREAMTKGDALDGARVALHDVIESAPGYNLRYSLHTNRYADTLIPVIVTALNRVEGLERVEVFHGKTP